MTIAAAAAGAVLVFWMLGAYNRLVALRSAIGAAWIQVDVLLRQRGASIEALAAGLREAPMTEPGALDSLLAAQARLRTTADALCARPVGAGEAAAVAAADAELGAAAARVLALAEHLQQGDAQAGTEWTEGDARLDFARRLFNDTATRYDAAIQQFPTTLLARLYGFGPAGRI